MSFEFDIEAAKKLPKLSKEESKALHDAYERDVKRMEQSDSNFIPLLPIDSEDQDNSYETSYQPTFSEKYDESFTPEKYRIFSAGNGEVA